MNIRVGILDTGISSAVPGVVDSAAFLDPELTTLVEPSECEHGSQIALIVRSHAPSAELLDARAFVAGHPSTAARIAAAVDWLVLAGAQIMNLSFGLQNDRAILAAAITQAQAAGVHCIASSPAQGLAVFPANYPAVVSVSGDARCNAGQFSLLEPGPEWHFGAANGGPNHRAHQRGHGASFACAHVSGALAQLMGNGIANNRLLSQLAEHCDWRGRECRS